MTRIQQIGDRLRRPKHAQNDLFKEESVEVYAKEAAISIKTARWHVKQIYAKTVTFR